MTEAGKKLNKGTFKKRAHRPWKSALLEQTIQETALELENSLFELDIDLDLDLDTTENLDSFYPELDFTEEVIAVTTPPKQVVTTPIVETIAEPIKELAVVDPADQKNADAKPINKILLGGFFKTQQTISQSNLEATRKINALLADLKVREFNTEANEAKVRQAIEQANIISQQFNTALEQANKAATAHQTEINLRIQVESQLKDAQLRIGNLQTELKNEQQMRLAAEQSETNLRLQVESQLKDSDSQVTSMQLELQAAQQARMAAEAEAQHALATVTYMKDLEIELEDAVEKLMNKELEKNSVEHKLAELQQQYTDLKSILAKANTQLENQTNQNAEFEVKSEKLKAVIATEQQLRKIAEQQVKEYSQRAAKVEKVLHLLNGSIAPEANLEAPKKEIITSYAYEPDDLEY